MDLGSDGARIIELAERAGMTKQSMGALVTYLEQRGYESVAPDPQDRRAKIVRRTKKAMGSEAPARRNIARVQQRWSRLLGAGEMEELVRSLRKLNDRLAEEHGLHGAVGEG